MADNITALLDNTKMPIKWTSELDSILLHGVFEECQISFGKALCDKISERVKAAGEPECTPKAIENRLYSWKKKNVSSAAATTSTPKKTAGTPKKAPETPKTPRSKKGAAKKNAVESEETVDDEEMPRSPAADRKRASEGTEEPEAKKMKTEIRGFNSEDEE